MSNPFVPSAYPGGDFLGLLSIIRFALRALKLPFADPVLFGRMAGRTLVALGWIFAIQWIFADEPFDTKLQYLLFHVAAIWISVGWIRGMSRGNAEVHRASNDTIYAVFWIATFQAGLILVWYLLGSIVIEISQVPVGNFPWHFVHLVAPLSSASGPGLYVAISGWALWALLYAPFFWKIVDKALGIQRTFEDLKRQPLRHWLKLALILFLINIPNMLLIFGMIAAMSNKESNNALFFFTALPLFFVYPALNAAAMFSFYDALELDPERPEPAPETAAL